jgi:hypothetical protein
MKALNHSDPKVTMNYLKIDVKSVGAALQTFGSEQSETLDCTAAGAHETERLTQGAPEHLESNQNTPAVRVHLVNL